MRKGRRPNNSREEGWIVVTDEGVVLREDVVRAGQVKTRDQVQPDRQRVQTVVVGHAGGRV